MIGAFEAKQRFRKRRIENLDQRWVEIDMVNMQLYVKARIFEQVEK